MKRMLELTLECGHVVKQERTWPSHVGHVLFCPYCTAENPSKAITTVLTEREVNDDEKA